MHKKLKDGTVNFHENYDCSSNFVDTCSASSMSTKRLEQAFCEYITRIAAFEEDNTIYLYEQEQKRQENQALIASYEEKLRQEERR